MDAPNRHGIFSVEDSDTPTREATEADVRAAMVAVQWYADAKHIGHPDDKHAAIWVKHLRDSWMSCSGFADRASATVRPRRGRGVLVGHRDGAIALVSFEALRDGCRGTFPAPSAPDLFTQPQDAPGAPALPKTPDAPPTAATAPVGAPLTLF